VRYPSATRRLTVPKRWTRSVQNALVNVMSLAHYALLSTRSWAANAANQRVRLSAKTDQLTHEIRLLREELRIKDARLARIPASRRPHYQPTERLAILELRALRGWSLAQTARVFLVTPPTIAAWFKRLDDHGPAALLRTAVPVNKFPDFVRYLVQRLQTLSPRLGKVKIAQLLARAGLHLGVSSVGRMRRERPLPPSSPRTQAAPSARGVTAKRPNHVWDADLTTVPTSAGFWTSWLPFALPQFWPFCWWFAVVLDHYSRRVQGFGFFKCQPTAEQVREFLRQVIGNVGATPKYLVTDQGPQFCSHGFKNWCRRHGIRQRFGAVGKQGSIAVIERWWRTLKEELQIVMLVSLARRSFHYQAQLAVSWYNANRPHMSLKGATPDEVYFGHAPACRQPRFEPRPDWPRAAPCARPRVLVKGQPGVWLEMSVDFVCRQRHLPLVTLQRAA
jgi:putative transposase